MHIVDGIGDVKGLVRDDIPKRKGGDKMARRAGPGESPYTVYDRDIASRAQIWLHEEAPKWRDRPWVLFVSFVAPHFPLTAPAALVLPLLAAGPADAEAVRGGRASASSLSRHYAHTVDYDPHFALGGRRQARRSPATAASCRPWTRTSATCCAALRDAGLEQDTRVIYTSDHGDNAGARGLWGKSTFYEESAGVPLIRRRPGHSGRARGDHAGVAHRLRADHPRGGRRGAARVGGRALPGASLFAVADGATPTRPVISEYHAIGSVAGAFMLRFGRWKYCHYVAYPPQLFDLEADPGGAGRPRRRSATRGDARRGRAPVARGARPGSRRRAREAAAGRAARSCRGPGAALARGDLGFTPAPGTAAEMN